MIRFTKCQIAIAFLLVLVCVLMILCFSSSWGDNFLRLGRIDHNQLVSVVLRGRLGNQLFQISTAYAYARDNKLQFAINQNLVQKTVHEKTYLDTMFRWVPDTQVSTFQTYKEPQFGYQEVPYFQHNVQLYGYFQSWKYFHRYRDDILRLLHAHTSTTPDQIESFLQKHGSHTKVSLHVRRGDYVGNSFHISQELCYYTDAIEIIQSHIDDFTIVVFSDDIPWCKQTFGEAKIYDKITYVTEGDEENQMYFMSECQHHIIANSSYSWWGAYLNRNFENAIVVAPSLWFSDTSIDVSSIYFPNWYIL
jgi:hypothetical protein